VSVVAAIALLSTSFAQILGRADLRSERRGHTATLLSDGRVLIVGGLDQTGAFVADSEIFDPASATGPTLSAPPLGTARADHTATLLANGRVLVVGGRSADGTLASTEIFDPAAGTFSSGPSLSYARAGHTATTLSDGRIVVAGGDDAGTVEIIEPTTLVIVPGGSLLTPRERHAAAALGDGTVLVAGGVSKSGAPVEWGEVYYPAYGMSKATGFANVARTRPLMRALPDG